MGNEQSAEPCESVDEKPTERQVAVNSLPHPAWEPCAEPPLASARECVGVALEGSRLLVFGGLAGEPSEPRVTNDAFVFDARSKTWSKLEAEGLPPHPRTGHCMARAGSTVVVGFGLCHDRGYLADVCLLDLAAKKWSRAALSGEALPSARDKMAAASSGERVWLHGGFGPLKAAEEAEEDEEEEAGEGDEAAGAGSSGAAGSASAAARSTLDMGWHDDLYTFDVRTHRMTKQQPAGAAPCARAAHSLVALEGGAALVAFGGRAQAGRLNETWRLDTHTVVWTRLSPGGPCPAPRSFHSACALGPSLMATFGGLDRAGKHSADVHLLELRACEWVKVPARGAPAARASCALCCAPDAAAAEPTLLLFGGSSEWQPELGAPAVLHGDTHSLELGGVCRALAAAEGAAAEGPRPPASQSSPARAPEPAPPAPAGHGAAAPARADTAAARGPQDTQQDKGDKENARGETAPPQAWAAASAGGGLKRPREPCEGAEDTPASAVRCSAEGKGAAQMAGEHVAPEDGATC